MGDLDGDLIGKVALVTGASVAVSARTVAEGESRFDGTIAETVAQIEAAGGRAIDVLVSNAAVTWFTPVVEFSEKHYALMFEVQVTAPFDLSRRVVPGMRERGGGAILNISSRAAIHPPPTRAGRGGTVYGMCNSQQLLDELAANATP